jgi:hypothetical protein
MRNIKGKPNLAAKVLLSGFLPLTAGTCFVASAEPCFARGGDDVARVRDHAGHRRAGFAGAMQVPNGFTQAFNEHVQRQTRGVDARRFDLDLSSTVRNIQLGTKLFNGLNNVTINAGGASQTFSAGDQVTAAQYVAIQQVISQSPQSISVSSDGTATGGSFSLNQSASHVNDMVIPQSVSAVSNFAADRSIKLSGDLTNMGSIYGLSTSNRVRSGVISADDINNSGHISTDLTGSFLQSVNGTVKHVDLTVVAENNLNNSGSITSSGALTAASAYGAVNNSGSMSAQKGDLNVFAGNGNLTNSGAISALNGNLNIGASQLATDLMINGQGGSFTASGDINVRDASYTELNDTTLTGGTYSADNLNLYGGGGTINAFVDEIDGAVNSTGLAAHVLTKGGTLTLGDNCLTGDPTFVNTTGDILINGALIAREDITILAAGNIIATGNAFISTQNSTGQTATPSTDITLVAGGVVTTTGTSTSGAPSPGFDIGAGQTATVNFPGGLGGNIDFSASKYLGPLISTRSTLSGTDNQQDNGGDVTLVAFGANADTGYVLFPEARPSIDTSSLYANAGSVTIIANGVGSTKSATIRLGGVNTSADPIQGNNGGDVLILTAIPETTTGAAITYNSAGARVGAVNYETNPVNLSFTSGFVQFTGAVSAGDGNVTVLTDTATGGGTGGIVQKGTNRIQGDIVTFTTGVGGIGSGSSKKAVRILTDANVLVLSSQSNVFINNLGSVNIGNVGTPGARAGNLGTFDLSTTADDAGDGRITVGNNGTVQALTGTLSVINLTSSGDVGGTGGIRTQGTSRLIATTINLADVNPADGVKGLGFGDIGQGGPINMTATNVSANTQGSVELLNLGSINVLDSSAGDGETFDLQTDPDPGSGNGRITLVGTIAAPTGIIGTLTLRSSENGGGLGGIVTGGGALIAESINLSDDNNAGQVGRGNADIGTIDNPIAIVASDLDVDTLGNGNIVNTIKTGMTLQNLGAAGFRLASFTLTNASTIHAVGDSFVVNLVNLTAQGTGNIILSGDIDISGGAGVATLTTSSGFMSTDGASVIAPNVVLNSTSGSVGTELNPFSIEANQLSSNVAGYTNIYSENTASITLNSALSKNQFNLTSDGQMNIATPIISATGIKLNTTGNFDIISNGFNIGNSKTTNIVEINSDGGDIDVTGIGVVSAKTLVVLSTDGGAIGLSNPLAVNTTGLSANTTTNGVVNISSAPTKKVPLILYNSGAGGDFTLNAQGSLLLNNIQTTDGSITVVTTTGTLSTNTNAIIQVAEAGNRTTNPEQILLQNSGVKKSGIVIGQGTTIATFIDLADKPATGAGDIIIRMGGPVAQTNTTPPANVTVNTTGSGGVFFGANGITALAPNNTMNALNADIQFDTNGLPATAITLGGDVTITADPPYTGPMTTVVGPSVQAASQASAVKPLSGQHDLVASSGLTSVSSVEQALGVASLSASQSDIAPTNSLAGFSDISTALATVQNAINFTAQPREGWVSDTELVSGQIPAQVFGDVNVSGDEIAGAELEYPTSMPAPSAVSQESKGGPLVGGVSTNVGAPKEVTLRRGTIVVAPSSDTVVKTPVGQIKIGAKSLALVMAFADGLAVYDLDDVKKGAIEITAAGTSMTLSPGQHLFIARDSVKNFEDVNPAQMIGYRGITRRDIGSGFRVFSAEFAVPHAVHAVAPLKALMQSNHPQNKKVASHLLKTTAAIMQLRGNSGAYQQVFRPRKTAWMQ